MCSGQMFEFGVLIRNDSLITVVISSGLGLLLTSMQRFSLLAIAANVISHSLALSFSFSFTASLWRKADRHNELLYFYSSL